MKELNLEHMIVDSAAGIGCQVIASLGGGADVAILIAEPTPASLSDVQRAYKVVQHFREPAYLIINKADINPALLALRSGLRKRASRYWGGGFPTTEPFQRA